MQTTLQFAPLAGFADKLLWGTWATLQLAFWSILFGTAIGILGAVARSFGPRWLSFLVGCYVELIRNTPLLIQLYFVFFTLPLAGLKLASNEAAILALSIHLGAYATEILRAGIQSVPRGQVAAGYAVGMTYRQCMQLIVLPQAFRNMLPVLLTQTIILFQDTSLVYAVGAYDLLKGFEVAGKNFNRPVEMYLLAAVTYFVICFSLSMLVRRLQKKIAIIR